MQEMQVPWVGKIPWRRKQQPTPVFLPGKSYGQRSLAGSSPRGRKGVRHNLATKQAEKLYSMVCIHQIFVIDSSVDRHSGFHVLHIVNSPAMHIGSMYPFKLWLSGDRCPGVGSNSSTFSAAPLIQTWSICLHCLLNARPRDSLSNNRKRLTYNKWASARWLLARRCAGGWGAPVLGPSGRRPPRFTWN